MEQKYTFATRAEQLGKRVFDYFAMPAQSFYVRLLDDKAAVLVGGRGTGKTMLLKSLAFEYRVNNLSAEDTQKLWLDDKYIGCYIRVDTNIVSSFRGRGIDDEFWGLLFAHYFNLRVTQQIVKTLRIALNYDIIKEENLSGFVSRYFELLGESDENKLLKDVEVSIRRSLDKLILYVNNAKRFDCPILTNNGTMIFDLCNCLSQEKIFESKTWFILLDEYENLNENQQRIINTLIKANQPPTIFKIAMRPGGWWTQQTLTISESLEAIADFDMISYQTDFSDEDYTDLIVKAFHKSLALNNITDPKYLNVRNLLPNISPEDEALSIYKRSKKQPTFENEIQQIIEKYAKDEKHLDFLKSQLIVKNEPLRTRLHLVLLNRGENPDFVASERYNNSAKYKEWYKHNRMGTLFLFCKDYRVKKIYAGFEDFVSLSSKVMRNFVSLFSRTWELAMDEGFSPQNPKAFDIETQSRAAYDISQGKVFEISSYASIGPALSSFANQIGRIFEQLNKDELQSQPERNHFAVVKGEISFAARMLVRGALMHSVLQETAATKVREDIEIRDRDFLLNRIYCPYYNISFRKMHKLEIKAFDFEALITGSDQDKRNAANKILKLGIEESTESNVGIRQLDLTNVLLGGQM